MASNPPQNLNVRSIAIDSPQFLRQSLKTFAEILSGILATSGVFFASQT